MIKLLKLISGEYIVSNITESEDSGKITLNDPLVVNLMPSDNNQLGISLFPLNPFDLEDGTITILKNHILFEVKSVPEQISQQYIKTTSGIEVVNEMPPNIKKVEKS